MAEQDDSKGSLKERLEDACEDLWWSSEADYPVEVVWQPKDAIAPIGTITSSDSLEDASQKVLEWLRSFDEQSVEVIEVDRFFERAIAPKSWHTPEDKEQRSRIKQLKDLLVIELSHLQVYRCGEVEVTVYVLGYSQEGALAGVRTVLVET